MFSTLKQIFIFKDLRKKILYTIALLVFTRILAHIPLPGVDLEGIKKFFDQSQLFGFLNMFTGGTMENFSIILMGVGPYITSSIVFQLLAMIVPSLEALSKEGDWGRQRINHYTRITTVPLALIQSYAMITLLRSQGLIGEWDIMTLITILISVTAGTILLMWLGELISENGIGNGVSLIISLGIISGVPSKVASTLGLIFAGSVIDYGKLFWLLIFLVISVLAVALIVWITEGERRIPVTYARRGQGGYRGVDTHLPLRVNAAGVIPIIFAISMMVFPGTIAKFFEGARSKWLADAALWVSRLFENNVFYSIVYFILVFLFTFFYTSVIFHPNEVAENLQKNGGFVPGLRPGRETAEYLSRTISRITFVSALFLGVIAVLPFIIQSITKLQTLVLGGTSILIMVSVVIETVRQIQAQLVTHRYEEY